jgi:gamma-glutamylcyclotransferase (GGCT)/AIG2-like uncharacterized protein YtfP
VTPYLFVYGTLRQGTGHPMSQYLSKNANLLGIGHTHGRLYRISWYPGAVVSAHPDERIVGELYELHQEGVLKRLDQYEDYNPDRPEQSDFVRRLVTAYLAEDPAPIQAWIYEYNRPITYCDWLVSGDFLKES